MSEASEQQQTVELPSIRPSTAWIYGSLGFPIAMLGYPLGAYIPRLYSTEMGISLTAIGLVIMAAAIFDAITDPLMGHFSDRWRTRWGRRRPWMVVGLPLWTFLVLRNKRALLANTSVRLQYGFLYNGYAPRSYYWEVVSLVRKELLAGVAVFLAQQGTLIISARKCT